MIESSNEIVPVPRWGQCWVHDPLAGWEVRIAVSKVLASLARRDRRQAAIGPFCIGWIG